MTGCPARLVMLPAALRFCGKYAWYTPDLGFGHDPVLASPAASGRAPIAAMSRQRGVAIADVPEPEAS